MTSFIYAMSKDSDVNVISTPQILTMDNKEAEIKVGKNVPYLTRQDTDSTNIDRTVNSYDYRDVGVTLKLTPQINQMGNIRMKLFQEISTLVAGTGEAQYAPTTLKRSASTTVTVKDSSTIVIGGLTGDTLSLSNYRVPLLGDIPILGYLFKSLTKSREQTTLYIFLTPRIIDTEQRVEALFREKEKRSEEAKDPSKFSKGAIK
jgi:general secretion pathway protein D